MADVLWKQTFKKNGVVYKNAAVSVYYAGTTDAVSLFDVNSVQQNDAPQCYTDSAGYVEFTLNSDDFHTGQLFDLTIAPNSVCSDADAITLSSMMLLQDTEGGREYKQVFAQDSAPSGNYKEGDLWFDTNYDNHAYRANASLTWVSMRDGSISLVGYSNGIFAETWEDESRLTNYWTVTGITPTIVTGEGLVGGKVLRVGDNSGNDECLLVFNTNIPFDRTRKYRYKVRAKQSAGSGKVYCGWAALKADGTTFIDYDGTESSSVGTITQQFWHSANNWAPGGSWAESEGYTFGVASPGTTAQGTVGTPGTIHSSAAYVRPLLLVNYNDAAGTVDIDAIIVEMLPPDADYVDETAAKYWAVEAGADKTSDNTSDNTSNVGTVTASNVAGWAYSGNNAKINGGVIADYIQSTNYNGSSAGIKFDLTNAKLYVYEASGLVVYSSGGMTLKDGADLTLECSSSSSGEIIFSYTSYADPKIGGYLVNYSGTNYPSIILHGGTADSSILVLSDTSIYRFKYIIAAAQVGLQLSISSTVYLTTSSAFYVNGTADLGTTSYPWRAIYLDGGSYYWRLWHYNDGAGFEGLWTVYNGTGVMFVDGDGNLKTKGYIYEDFWTLDIAEDTQWQLFDCAVDAFRNKSGSYLHSSMQKCPSKTLIIPIDEKGHEAPDNECVMESNKGSYGKPLGDLIQVLYECVHSLKQDVEELKHAANSNRD